jgi:hypothetical protein
MAENGRLNTASLVAAYNGAPGQLLEPQTAAQWAWMCRDAEAAGVHLAPEADDGVPSCYRDYAGQEAAWAIYQRDGHPLAAVPGTSNHGEGTAVDIDLNPAVSAWLAGNASRYGFAFDVSGEPWHAHRITTIQVPANTPAGEEEDMRFVKIQGKAGARRGGTYAIRNGVATFLGDAPADIEITDEAAIVALQAVVSGLR